jgi:predicted lysophospholipase L1 biosynthesis ABC-type transport system permease subunit
MPFLNQQTSVVESIALAVAGLVVLAAAAGVLANLGALRRYFRIRKM